MILITKIKLSNYRQYRNIELLFSKDKNLNLLIAKNGTGKTTLLNAIIWCLYGEEFYEMKNTEAKSPVLTDYLIDESTNKLEKAKVEVEIYDNSTDETFVFNRELVHKIMIIDGIKQVTIGRQEFYIKKLSKMENDRLITDETEIQNILEYYFAKSLFKYYFFDGEHLEHFFRNTLETTNAIKKSVDDMSQISYLEKVIRNSNDIISNINPKSNEQKEFIEWVQEKNDYENRLEAQKKDHSNVEVEIRNHLNSLKEKKLKAKKYEQYNNVLSYLANLKNENEERMKSLSEAKKDLDIYLIKIYPTLQFYPEICSTLQMIERKEKNDELPPEIDRNLLEKLIELKSCNCPLCNNLLDDKSFSFIERLIEKTKLSTRTAVMLSTIKNSLLEIKKEAQEFNDNFSKKQSRIDDINKKIEDINKKIDEKEEEKNKLIAELPQGENELTLLDNEIEDIEKRLASAQSRKGSLSVLINDYSSKIDDLNTKIKKYEKEKSINDEQAKKVALYNKILNDVSMIKKNLSDTINMEIEKQTWEIFDSMIWKKETFGKISIDDNYNVKLYNKNGREMTKNISATESMALAYAFTLAIHNVSGKNCPLVIDSPLNRVSDDNRTNMSKELLASSNSKQIIMVITPDEYSDNVKAVISSNNANIRTIRLNNKESEIDYIGEINE